jgi:hypothetical protein
MFQGTESLLADFQIYISDHTGTNQMSICRDAKEFTNQQGRGKFQVARDRLMNFVQPDGAIHLCCDIEYLPMKNSAKKDRKIWNATSEVDKAIREATLSLFTDSIHTDVEISVSFIKTL